MVASIQMARATARYWSAPGCRLSCSEVVQAGSRQATRRPRGRPRSAQRSEPDHSSRWRPSAPVTVTDARIAPRPSRQSWGSSITRAENDTSPESANGNVTAAGAGIINARPSTPSGFIAQCAPTEPASSRIRNTDNGNRPGTAA